MYEKSKGVSDSNEILSAHSCHYRSSHQVRIGFPEFPGNCIGTLSDLVRTPKGPSKAPLEASKTRKFEKSSRDGSSGGYPIYL